MLIIRLAGPPPRRDRRPLIPLAAHRDARGVHRSEAGGLKARGN